MHPVAWDRTPDTRGPSTELQHSLVGWNLPIVPADTGSVRKRFPKFPVLWQMTGHPCCLSKIQASSHHHVSSEAEQKKQVFTKNRAWYSKDYASFVPICWIERVLWLWWSIITHQHVTCSCLISSLSVLCQDDPIHSFISLQLKMGRATGSCWTITWNMIVEKDHFSH